MSFVHKGLTVGGGQLLVTALYTSSTILFSRLLGPDGVGQIDLVRSTGVLVVTFATIGLGQANIYFLNNCRIPAPKVVTNALKTAAVIAPLVAIALAGAIFIFAEYFGSIPLPLAVAFAAGVGAHACACILRPILVAKLAAVRMVAVDLLNPLCLIMGVVTLAALGTLTSRSALLVLSLGYWASFMLLLVFLRDDFDFGLPFDWSLLGNLVTYGLKLAAANILLVLSSTITIMLLRYLRPDDFSAVGLFARAAGVCGLAALVPNAVGPLLYAKWAGVTDAARITQAERAVRLNIAYAAAATLALVLAGKYILWLLYGAEFISAQYPLRILAPASVFAVLFGVSNNLLAGDGRAMVTTYILCGTVAVVVGVAWLAIPAWGEQGAALATLCGSAFTAAVSLATCRRLYGVRPLHCFVIAREDFTYLFRTLRIVRS